MDVARFCFVFFGFVSSRFGRPLPLLVGAVIGVFCLFISDGVTAAEDVEEGFGHVLSFRGSGGGEAGLGSSHSSALFHYFILLTCVM